MFFGFVPLFVSCLLGKLLALLLHGQRKIPYHFAVLFFPFVYIVRKGIWRSLFSKCPFSLIFAKEFLFFANQWKKPLIN